MGVQRAKPSVDHRNDRNSYTQCAPKRVNFPHSPGDCGEKRGSPAREGFPSTHSRYGNFFFLNNVDRNISETVKKGENRQRMQALFPFALRKGKTWSFDLPVRTTGIFSIPFRVSKTVKTPTQANPFETCNPLKRIDLNFSGFRIRQVFRSHGSFGGFQAP